MEWTLDRLASTLQQLRERGSEDPHLEVKKASDGYPANIAETLCAFSNMPDGGTIICGVNEAQNFTITGVYSADDLEKSIASTLRNALTPKGSAAFSRLTTPGGAVLIVEVAPLPITERPCYYRGKAYMRYSDGDYAMDDYEVTRVLAARERKQNDTVPVFGSCESDLDAAYLEKFIIAARQSSRRLQDIEPGKVLRRKSVVSADGESLSLAGLYALGEYPQQFYPSLKVSGFVEAEGVRNADKLEADGPLVEMLDQTMSWLVRNLRTSVVDDGKGGLRNQPEIPLIVLRELVANALVHRALDTETAYSKDVVIRLLRDRIVITNPGGLWAITAAHLAEPGHKTAVNSALYEICKLAQMADGSRVIEGEGNGIYEAQKAMSEAGLEPIEFVDRGFQFTAIVRRATVADGRAATGASSPALVPGELGATEQQIYDYLLIRQAQTVADIMESLGLTRRQVAYNLTKLEEDGYVVGSVNPGERARRFSARS